VSVVANVAINIDGKQARALLKAIQGEVDKLNGSFQDLEPKPKTFGQKIKDFAQSAVGQLAAVTGAAFTLQQAFTTLADQSKAEGALRTLGVDAGVATQQFTQLSKELKGQASVVELTAAAYDVASAGFLKTADQTKILEAATKGAVGGMSDINTVGNAVTSVLNAYGMSADQAAGLVDGFIQTQNDGKIVLAEYAQLIGRLAPIGAAAGVGIKELNAAVATITAQGVAPAAAVTGLAQAISSILKPTAEAQTLAKELGIDFTETGLRSKGLGGFLNEVATATGGSSSKLTQLFGSLDAVKALLPLLSGDMKKFVENILKQDEAAGVATKAFNEMANTLGGALKEVDTAFKNLVVAFKPITPAIIAPFKILAGAVNLVTENIKALAVAATFIGTFALVVNGVAIATKAWAIATGLLAAAKKAAGIAAAFLQGVMNPASIATTTIALGVASAAAITLGNAMNEAGLKAEEAKLKQSGVAGATAAVKDEAAKLTEETNKQAAALDQIPPKQQAQVDAAQQGLVILQGQTAAINAQIASLERGASIASARYGAEKAINDLQGQQLERAYKLQTTAQGRLNIAVQIFNNAVNAAKIEYNQALENIALEQRKIELQVQLAQLKLKEIEAEGQLQILKSKDAAEAEEKQRQLDKALAAQNEVVTATQSQATSQQEIAKYQEQTAGAQLESKILAAQTALETKLTSDNIGLSQTNAVKLSTELANSARSTVALADDTKRVANNAATAATNFISVAKNADSAAKSIHNAANAQARLNALRSQGGGGGGGGKPPVKKAAEGAYWQGGFKAFAKGGIVTKPTMGLIGEGGENEFIIPQSKAAGFAANYLAGARGSSAIPSSGGGGGGGGGGGSPTINIQTGPVTQMNGTNYVTAQDMSRAVQSGVQQTINMMRNDRGTRQAVGLA
jgi:TP901 family phage tail tape measure protein